MRQRHPRHGAHRRHRAHRHARATRPRRAHLARPRRRDRRRHEARIALDLYKGAPAILNHPRVNEHLIEAAHAVLGQEAVHTIPLPSMGSEDFSHFLQHVPGAMYRLGTARADRPVHLLHSARFDVDERAIGYGARILSRAVVGLIGALREDREMLKG